MLGPVTITGGQCFYNCARLSEVNSESVGLQDRLKSLKPLFVSKINDRMC